MISRLPPKPPADRKRKPTADFKQVTEIVYVTAGILPKGCGAVYDLKSDRSRARKRHDCIALAETDAAGTLHCPWCSRILDPEETARLQAAKAKKAAGK